MWRVCGVGGVSVEGVWGGRGECGVWGRGVCGVGGVSVGCVGGVGGCGVGGVSLGVWEGGWVWGEGECACIGGWGGLLLIVARKILVTCTYVIV